MAKLKHVRREHAIEGRYLVWHDATGWQMFRRTGAGWFWNNGDKVLNEKLLLEVYELPYEQYGPPMTPRQEPMAVACPTCGAKPGKPCIRSVPRAAHRTMRRVHDFRLDAVRKLEVSEMVSRHRREEATSTCPHCETPATAHGESGPGR